MSKKHNERCKDCKVTVYEFLMNIYGEGDVFQNYNLHFPNKIEELKSNDNIINSALQQIFIEIKKYRNQESFIKSKEMPNVDFYVKDKFILEFDESQHFTKPRLIALKNYPKKLSLGFNEKRWKELCETLDKKDNDPIYRDEQRAWYDTLRDFVPVFRNLKPTKRIYASEFEWCSLHANEKADIGKFKNILNETNE